MVPDSKDPAEFQMINLTKIARKFAEIENCFTLIIFEGILLDMERYEIVMSNFQSSISEKLLST